MNSTPEGVRDDALLNAQAWLDRWAVHVGNCRGATGLCTCGLHLARSEVSYALSLIDPPEVATPIVPTPAPVEAAVVERAMDAFVEHCGAFMADGTDVPLDAMRAALATLSLLPAGGWRSMYSAPRDGTHIMVRDEDGVTTAHWCACQEDWTEFPNNNNERSDYFAWMPLPSPPGGEGEGK